MSSKENRSGRPKKALNPFNELFRNMVGSATQQEIAEKIGVSRQNVGRWISGDTAPDINTLCKIADAYKVSTDYLLGRTSHKTTDTKVKAMCDYMGLTEKSVKNITSITKRGLNVDLLLEHDSFKDIIELLNSIVDTVITTMFVNSRSAYIKDIENIEHKKSGEIAQKYTLSIVEAACLQSVSACMGISNLTNVRLLAEYALTQKVIRGFIEDIEKEKDEYKALFAPLDDCVEDLLNDLLEKKQDDSKTAEIIKQVIDFYHNHIRKE